MLKGTKTLQNLVNSFAGESQARNRYTYFASIAKKEGYEQISAIFLETADNEKEHAKIFYKYIPEGIEIVTGSYPFLLGTTLENLKSAVKGEHDEWSNLYLEGAKIAEKEGFSDIAKSFEYISEVEKSHEKRFQELLNNIENNTVFEKSEVTAWKCRKCGYIYKNKKAPELCPSCGHEQAYFEIVSEKF